VACVQKAFWQYWERTLAGKLIVMAARGPVELAALAAETGIAKADIIKALGPDSRLAELRLVHWLRSDYICDVATRSLDALHELYALLTEGRHCLVVEPSCLTVGSPRATAGGARPKAKR
jgi:hypothetical protein